MSRSAAKIGGFQNSKNNRKKAIYLFKNIPKPLLTLSREAAPTATPAAAPYAPPTIAKIVIVST